jgi:hypothetical protein
MILLIFIFVWFYPVLKRHRQMEAYADKKTKLKALLFGLVPATVVLFSCQFALGWLFKLAGISDKGILICFLRGYIMYALIEELTKFGFAYLVIKKFEKLKKIDIMLIFGLVGMGYEITETLFVGNLFSGIGRGLFVAHIMYQLIMGHFFYESIHAKENGDDAGTKKNKILSLAIPMLLHGTNDLFCELAQLASEGLTVMGETDTPKAIMIFTCAVMIMVTNVFGLVWGLKLAKKDPEVEVCIN